MHRLLVVMAVAGCVPTSYAYTPSGSRSFEKRAEGCEFEVTTTPPTKDFEEVGTLLHYNGDVPQNLDKFKAAVAKQVCSLGGDGVIAISSVGKGYDKGTIFHYPRPFKP
jgi:hypothetical protein